MTEPLAHVPVDTAPDGPARAGQECTRCHKRVKPPYYPDDVDTVAPCWQCKASPPEGYSAFCHECQCSGIVRSLGMCRCGAKWNGQQTCHCSACHLTFTSLGPFDAHRPGRCLSETQLRAKGYEPNQHGHWRKPAPEGTFAHRKGSSDAAQP